MARSIRTGGAYRFSAKFFKQSSRHRMAWRTHGNARPPTRCLARNRRATRQHQRQGSWPQPRCQLIATRIPTVNNCFRASRIQHMCNERIVGGSPFHAIDLCDSARIKGQCTKPIDRLCWECNRTTSTHRFGGALDRKISWFKNDGHVNSSAIASVSWKAPHLQGIVRSDFAQGPSP